MAIGTDDTILKYGTIDDIGNTGGAVANDAWSDNNDLNIWQNTDDAPMAAFVLEAAWTTAPTVGGTVTLHAQLLNLFTTEDEPDVDSNFIPRSLGGWVVDNVGSSTTMYFVLGPVELPSVKSQQEYRFYIYNNSGQQINDAGWKVHVVPISLGPHT